MTPETLMDVRVPQPGRESEYGVPPHIVEAAAVLYRARNRVRDDEVNTIDEAIMRLYGPWIRPPRPREDGGGELERLEGER